jgi:hypothetical protein
MIDASTAGFGKFVPGFDFLQNLVGSAAKGATAGMPQMPNLGNWVAPTLSVEELDKRIEELKAVQFWLDQNAVALKATIQALEVQKMTVATLKGLNVNLTDLAEAFKFKMPQAGSAAAPAPTPAPTPAPAWPPAPTPAWPHVPEPAPAPAEATQPPAVAIDPLKWWGALTEQFQAIATTAVNEVALKAAQAAKASAATATANTAKGSLVKATAAKKTAAPRKAAAAPRAKPAAKKTAPTPTSPTPRRRP